MAREIESVERVGWYGHLVNGGGLTGFDAHTHGLEEKYNHPNFQILISLPKNTVQSIFWGFVDRIKEGERFEHGGMYSKIIKNFPVQLAWARESGRRVLRIILPDPQGCIDRKKMTNGFDLQWEGTEPIDSPASEEKT